MNMPHATHLRIATCAGMIALASTLHAQDPAAPPAGRGRGGPQAPPVVSPEEIGRAHV